MIKIEIGKSIKAMGNQSLFITFPYSGTILDKIRMIPDRIYHPDLKCWEVSTLFLDKVKKILKDEHFAIYGKLEYEELIDYNYTFKTTPMAHQLDAYQYGLKNKAFLLGDVMGLGKTKESLDLACILKENKGIKRVLIICGVNNLKYNWVDEIKKHTNENCWILGSRRLKNGKYRIGKTENKIEDLRNLDKDVFFMITNIESFRNSNFALEVQRQCDKGNIDMLIYDEAHTMKNPSAIQTKGVIKLRTKYMLAMSGTFMLNRPLDLYSSLHWIGVYKESYWRFKNTFSFCDSWGNVIGVKNVDMLKKLISSCMLRRLKEDVLDLPDKIYIEEKVEMGEEQEQIYNEVMNHLRENIDKIRLSPNPLNEMLRARQATGCTSILSSTINESAKLDRLEELVDEITANGYKCLIFSNWVQMVNCALPRLKKYNPAVITGEYKDEVIEEQKKKFHNNQDCKVAIGTIGKMGTGLTFNEANYVIFLDSPWTKGVKEQAVDRCHRIGQTKNVTIITLVTKDTIDEKIEQIVEEKGLMSDMLIDGKNNNHKLVDFLLG